MVNLEGQGVPGVFIASDVFEDGALRQATALGADPAAVYVPHPIQDRTDEEMVALAREKKIHYASTAMSTDYDCWLEEEEPVTWEMIKKTMSENADKVIKLFLHAIPKIQEQGDICSD